MDILGELNGRRYMHSAASVFEDFSEEVAAGAHEDMVAKSFST